jgi:AGZA family xanthine/uracil permease-like MFS transporter
MSWFVRGDLDGFFGLALDNIVQLLLINSLCSAVLGFGPELLYGRVLPGVAVSLLIGNLFYGWQAKRLGDRLGRSDVCALPFGINTPSVFAYIFLVMLPAKLMAVSSGATAEAAARAAWHAGLIACIGSGLIEFFGAFVAEKVRKSTPRAALLSTLAGISLTFISVAFLFQTYARPIVGLTTLGLLMLAYFGRLRFRGGVPSGLVIVFVGTALSWATHLAPNGAWPGGASVRLPVPVIGDLIEAMRGDYFVTYLSIIIPMGLFNVIGSTQNIESAEVGGDLYATAPSLAVNGVGTLAAALFGSCFPTTIYIGHPGWKAMGARAGYSIANGLFISLLCLTGTVAHLNWAVPVDAGMAIVLWIGIVITMQAFTATPGRHTAAVVVGLLPGLAAWVALLVKSAMHAVGAGTPAQPFTPAIEAAFERTGMFLSGVLALEQGFIFSAMVLAAVTVMVIERRLIAAAVWCLIAAVLSLVGLMHSYKWEATDTVIALGQPAWGFVWAYTVMAVMFVGALGDGRGGGRVALIPSCGGEPARRRRGRTRRAWRVRGRSHC